MTALAEYYESGNAPHEALGRAARRLASGGALYLGGGVGIEKQRGTDGAEKYVITKADGAGGGASFGGPLSAVMRAFATAGASSAPDTPGGAASVPDPAAAARLRELADEEAEANADIRRYEARLQRKASNPRPLYSPAIVSDDEWEARRIEELKADLKRIAQERAKLIASGKVEEVEQARPGTNFTKIPPKNVKRLSGIVKHYAAKAHGFTACVRDQVKHGLSEDHAKRRCAVVTDLGAGTTKWRSGGKKSKVAEAAVEHALGEAVEAALGRLLVIEETMGAGATVELAEGAGGFGDVRDALGEGTFGDLVLLAAADHPFGLLFEGELIERAFSTKRRKDLASSGAAMPDGSFPIATKEDLKNAKRAIGRAPAGKRDAVKRHIRKRAKALGENVTEAELDEAFMAPGGGGSGSSGGPVARARQKLGSRAAGAKLPSANMRGKARDKNDPAKDADFEKKHPRGSAGTSAGGKFVQSGSSGAETRAVQARVGSKVDGQFGPKTKAAVRDFQRRHRLVVDGVVGHQTALALSGKFARARAAKTGSLSDEDRKRLSESAPKRKRSTRSGAPSRSGGGLKV